jgi:hypothetical protein
MSRYFFHFSPPPPQGVFFFALPVRVSGREGKDRRRGNRRWKALVTTMWNWEDPREWSSENLATTFVRSLGTACWMYSVCRRCSLEWMVVFKDLHIIPQRLARCVVVLLSKDDRPLSEAQVKTWVDNYRWKHPWTGRSSQRKTLTLKTKTKSRTGRHSVRT